MINWVMLGKVFAQSSLQPWCVRAYWEQIFALFFLPFCLV